MTPGESLFWERSFPGARMISRLRMRDGQVVEKLGPITLWMELHAHDESLNMRLRKVDVFGLPWPRTLLPRILARETATDGKLHFDVEAGFRACGRVVGYRGHLDLATVEAVP